MIGGRSDPGKPDHPTMDNQAQEPSRLSDLYPDDPEQATLVEEMDCVTVDFLERVIQYVPAERDRYFVINQMWNYGPGVMPDGTSYGAIGNAIPSFGNLTIDDSDDLTTLRGYIVAETCCDDRYPSRFIPEIAGTIAQLFLHLIYYHGDAIPAYFYEEGGLTKIMTVIKQQSIPIDGPVLAQLIQANLEEVSACDNRDTPKYPALIDQIDDWNML